jgi:cytidine deaminase
MKFAEMAMAQPDPELLAAAQQARRASYSPYSQFAVGAALRTRNGEIFCGTNVENLSFGLTLCAERAALVAAVTAGHREFSEILICAETAVPISPCGACRQVLAEFSPELTVFSVASDGTVAHWSLAELLPRPSAGILNRPS